MAADPYEFSDDFLRASFSDPVHEILDDGEEESVPVVQSLDDFFLSLDPVTTLHNKYCLFSKYFKVDYRIATGFNVINSCLPINLQNFVIQNSSCVVMPNIFNGKVVGVLLRSNTKKEFRYYSPSSKVPYGAGVTSKSYNQPWVIVESALDADFLRQFYPFVIASLGTAVSKHLTTFLLNTAPLNYFCFDTDDAGNKAYNIMRYKHKGYNIARILPPNKLKDFGEVLDHLFKNDFAVYEYELFNIQLALKGISC